MSNTLSTLSTWADSQSNNAAEMIEKKGAYADFALRLAAVLIVDLERPDSSSALIPAYLRRRLAS